VLWHYSCATLPCPAFLPPLLSLRAGPYRRPWPCDATRLCAASALPPYATQAKILRLHAVPTPLRAAPGGCGTPSCTANIATWASRAPQVAGPTLARVRALVLTEQTAGRDRCDATGRLVRSLGLNTTALRAPAHNTATDLNARASRARPWGRQC
jgi:hypothetical protein